MSRLAVLSCVIFAACGGASQQAKVDLAVVSGDDADLVTSRNELLREAGTRFPVSDHLVGYGAGDTPEMAENNAVADAAGLIKSEIVSNTRVLETEWNGKNETLSAADVAVKVTSDAGALIRPVRELTRKTGRRYEAIASASRTELARKYDDDARPKMDRLEALWRRVLGEPDSPTVPAALCEIDKLEQALDRTSAERRIATRRAIWTEEQLRMRREVRQLREDFKNASQVLVVRARTGELEAPGDEIVSALVKGGIGARLGEASACQPRNLVVTVTPRRACREDATGSLLCEVSYVASGVPCRSTTAVFDLESDRARGLHGTDENAAARVAAKRVDASAFAKNLAGRILASLGEGCARER